MAKARTKRKKRRRLWPFVLVGFIALGALTAWLSWAVFVTVIEPGKQRPRAESASKPPSERIMPEEKKELEEILKKRN